MGLQIGPGTVRKCPGKVAPCKTPLHQQMDCRVGVHKRVHDESNAPSKTAHWEMQILLALCGLH